MNVKRMFALGNQRRHNDRVAIQPVPFRKIHRLGNVHAKRQRQHQRQRQEQEQEQQRQEQQRQEQQQEQQQQEEQQQEEQQLQQEEGQEITFKIQTTKYLLNIANSLRSMLYGMKFSAEVMSSEEISREIEREIPGVHYIFLCIGHMFHLPKKSKYYIYNLEQVNYHPDFPLLGLVDNRAEFINTAFKNATNIFDYSEMNITNYPEDFKNKALYLPVPLEENPKIISEKEYDVLFFGGLNDRRKKILEYLKKDMNIRVVTNVFGEELYDMIKKARIVLNIHFKGESLLETARIYDCIRHSTPLIISEESIDKAVMEEYKDIVNFVPVIKEDLSNMDELVKGIQNLLSNGDICYSRWKAERKMQDMIKKRFDYFKIYKYPSLFHKYLLGISSPNKPITYELIQPDDKTFNNAKLFAHLHCYDISKFNEIYSEYIEKICSFFKVVITYSIGENNINDKRFVIIKIPNKGMDIGAKFCMVQYLNDNNISYEYIFFLHSKSDKEARRKYFMPLIENLNEGFIENINDYEGYFPDIQWEIQGNKLKIISGNPQFASSNLPERNLENRNDLLDYLGYENRTNRFVEGNVYILSKKIVDILFTDNKLYNILNAPDDFDYNWVRKRYGLSGDINNVYNDFKTKKLSPRDHLSYDGYTEHAFERVVLSLCDKGLFYPVKINTPLSKPSSFNATAFSYVLGNFIRIQDTPYSDNFKELYHKLKNIKTTKKLTGIFCSNGLGDFIITSNIINLNDFEFIYVASTRLKIIQKYINNYYPNLKVINIDDGKTYFSMSQWLDIHKSNKHYHTILNDCVDISIRIIFKMIDFYYKILDKNPWISDNTISYNHPAFNEMIYISNDLNFINKDEVYDINMIPNILKIKKYPIDLKKFNLENLNNYYIIFPYTADDAIDCPKCVHIHKKVDYCSYYRNFTRGDWIGVENYLLKKKMKGIILGVEDDFFPNNKIFLNLTNKINLFESIELLRNAKGYIGIDSWLSVVAPMFGLHDIKIKSVNTNVLLNYRCYWKDNAFIRKYRYNNFINLL